MKAIPLAVQMWTMREQLKQDIPGTLGRIGEIGYDGVELWFDQWPDPTDVKGYLDAAGLVACGSHVPFERLRDELDDVIAYHKTIGTTDIAVPWIPTHLTADAEAWTQRIAEIVAMADRCKAAGMRLSYHCHFVEFATSIEGREVFEHIMAATEPELLNFEMDTFFVAASGKDPVAYLRRFAGRNPLLHAKDWAAGTEADPKDESVGAGVVDWPALLAEAGPAGVEWIIVEQGTRADQAFENIAASYRYLTSQFGDAE